MSCDFVQPHGAWEGTEKENVVMWQWENVEIAWERFPNSHFGEKGERQVYLYTVF